MSAQAKRFARFASDVRLYGAVVACEWAAQHGVKGGTMAVWLSRIDGWSL